jgi:hypothetical protein
MDKESSNEPDSWWDARLSALEQILGPSDGVVGHSPVPFDLGHDVGGAADVLYFREHLPGIATVTAELIGREEQGRNRLGNYELMICEKEDPSWGASIISKLAYYTLDARLEPGETLDLGDSVPSGSTITAFLFSEYARFPVRQLPCGLLLCLGITKQELAACRRGRAAEVEAVLRKDGVYPFTDLRRSTVGGSGWRRWLAWR